MKNLKQAFRWKWTISFLLVSIIIFNVSLIIISQRQQYAGINFWHQFSNYQNLYSNSQYVSKHPTAIIPDETALSYAGAALIKGVNPVLIIADTPPLGKYLIGISEVISNNPAYISVIAGIISLFLLFLAGKQIFQTTTFAVLVPTLVSFEPIFKNQFIYAPLLDTIQLVFLLATFYFFNKGLKEKRIWLFFFLAMSFLGCFIATKFFITGIPIIAACFAVVGFHKEKERLIKLIFTAPLAIVILFLSYIRIFAFGYSLRSLFGIQKYIFLYHKSQLILPFSIWPLLLMNRWYVWFGNKPIISDAQWAITWPIVTVVSFFVILLYILKKIKHTIAVEVYMCWLIFYILLFSFGQITSRYLVIYIPILYLVSLYGVEKLIYNNSNITKMLRGQRGKAI